MPAPTNGKAPAYTRTRDDVGIVPYGERNDNVV